MSQLGSGAPAQTSTKTETSYGPEETAARAQIFSEGQNIFNQQRPTAGQYQGPGVVGFSEPSREAFGMQTDIARQGQGTAQEALRSANFNLNDARYVSSNPYAQDAIRSALDPIVRTHQQSTMPSLRLGGAASNTGMSTRQGIAEGLATEGLYRTLGNTSSTMASGMYGQGLQAATQTLGMLPNIMSGAQAPASMMSQVGTTMENQAQAEENYRAAQRLQERNGPWEILQNWGGLVGGMSNPTTTSTQTAQKAGLSPLQTAGGVLSLFTMLKGLGS